MTTGHPLLKVPGAARQGKRSILSLLGVSLVALALAASPVGAIASKAAKGETSAKADKTSDSKTTGKSETSTKKTPKKTETASAGDGEGKTVSKAAGKTKLADADDGKSEKSKSAVAAKTEKSADTASAKGKNSKLAAADDAKAGKAGKAKTVLADADDDAPAKASTRSSKRAAGDAKGKSSVKSGGVKSGAVKSGRMKTELALADDETKAAKGSKAKSSKDKAELADADDDKSVGKGSKSSEVKTGQSKAEKSGAEKSGAEKSGAEKFGARKTELADKDDDDGIKAIRNAKVRVVKTKLEKSADANCKPAKSSRKSKSSHRKKAMVCKISKEDLQLANALTKANATLSNAASHARFLPQPDVPAAPADQQTTALNAGPVPYSRTTTPGVLSDQDAQLYRTAFSQIDGGDFDDAEASLALVTDRSLVGYAEYHILMSTRYDASYDELVAWLGQYGDQPMAMKVWTMAKRRKPQGAPDPAFPSLNGAQPLPTQPQTLANAGNAVQLSATGSLTQQDMQADFNPGAPQVDRVDSDLTPKSARSAYNNGQLEQAVTLANKIGDHWVGGLANWRLKRYDQALTEFKFVSTDPSRNAWSQSSGAYWAARSALKLGDEAQADTYFKIAASFPFTFYGLLAEARLGVTPAVALAKKGLPPTYQGSMRNALAASLDNDSAWAQTNVQARRMSALVQLGRMSDAQTEAQKAMQTASDGGERDRWLALAAANRVRVGQLMTTDKLFDASLYPIPEYTLKSGDTGVDRALVFAFARKESKFNASAKSFAGAYGLMQLMPGTAALVENDSSFNSQPSKLLKPATNLRVGQKYIQRLMNSKPVGGDLLRTIAAYNAGPRPVQDAMNSVGGEADALLVMESIPVAETRQYVEEVAANYWIYRQLMGKATPSLSQAAADARVIDATTDASKDSAMDTSKGRETTKDRDPVKETASKDVRTKDLAKDSGKDLGPSAVAMVDDQ